MEQVIRLTVNGDAHTLAVAPNVTLLEVLRSHLGLTGTKRGCDLGDCGSCTVLMNGKPVNSCLVLAVAASGCEIVTIEGLEREGRMHPLQESFVAAGAIQCGFCTPGMVMSAKALIDHNPSPSVAEIKGALGGNLCRCAGYSKVIEAVRRWRDFAGGDEPGTERGEDERRRVVGQSHPRTDAPAKVTGRAVFTEDIQLPGMLHGRILTSPYAHAIIRRIDTSKAAAVPGVKAVITGKDVSDVPYGVSPARYDQHVLAKDKVRYVGDEVAAVAAVDEATAARALALIEVEYEPLPAVLDPFAAMADGAPVIHEAARYGNNVCARVDHHFGDVEQGFAEADVVLEQRFVGNFVYQSPLEPHCSIAQWDNDRGTVTVWSSTQVPHQLHHQLARVLELLQAKVRVIGPYVGGGFGGKAEATSLDFCAVYLAKKTGRPVKMVYTREDMFYHHRGRHKQYMDLKIGVKKNGKISAVEFHNVLDGGAYTSFGIITVYYAGAMLPTLYKLPNFKYSAKRMYTNRPPCGAMRGHGVPQPRFAFESLLDMLAERIGMDPIDLRIVNAMEPNTRTVNDLDVISCEFKATLEEVRKRSGWDQKRGKLPFGRGIGIGCGGFVSGAGYPIYRSEFPHSNAVIRVLEDGEGATLMIAAAEIGQGSETILLQVVAETLGLDLSDLTMAPCDTSISPIDLGSYSSRVTLMGGNAVKIAAEDINGKLYELVAEELHCEPDELTSADRRISKRVEPHVGMGFAEAARRYFSRHGPLVGTGSYAPPPNLGGSYKGATVGTSPAFSFGSSVCEVEVDPETGKVKIVKFTDAHDSGTIINPLTYHGQVEGSIVMGTGEVLFENVLFDDTGHILNANLHDYLIPTIADAPEIESVAVPSYEPRGPYGAKEVGEGSMVPVLGSIANAIYDAIGVRITELPITPEKIRKTLREKQGRDEGSVPG
ncbi:MAG TPA: molybdopterin cofactor-binding domain-containing protein [Thermoanaerobaculaceae bacterium]|nr:molybdopterin cofactor-binding domain-containing protein [Thermoanaerobaculaceae bacterium]